MKKDTVFQDYHGMINFIERNKANKLIIFLIDDDPFYLLMLKEELMKNPNFKIYTFKKGEEALLYFNLQPDLAIIDFHLNSQDPNAKNGALIVKEINKLSPNTETFVISSDHKLAMMHELGNNTELKIHYKNGDIAHKIKTKQKIIRTAKDKKWVNQAIFPSIIAASLLLVLVIYMLI
ncbi:response regulator [Vicingus serpentipes]|uniref:Response regulator n=1 Tax=Vicingus serpentipes TaxID=1926625 RepID=A0A5C6RX11_9FLAO|nr:response regulator [Vicingus serpentipes]TXB67106.1 response regulator [Vicingus serpentipes]